MSVNDLQKIAIEHKESIENQIKYLPIGRTIENSTSSEKIENLIADLEAYYMQHDKLFTEEDKKNLLILLGKHVNKQLAINNKSNNLTFSIIDAILDQHLELDHKLIATLNYGQKLLYLEVIHRANEEKGIKVPRIEDNIVKSLSIKYSDSESPNNTEIFNNAEEIQQISLDHTDLKYIRALSNTTSESNNQFEEIDIDSKHSAFYDSQENIYLYNKTTPLGAGENGVVVLALDTKTNENVVIKLIKKQHEFSDIFAQNEYKHSLKYLHNGKSLAKNFGNTSDNNILVLQHLPGKPFGDNLQSEKTDAKDLPVLLKQTLAIAEEISKVNKEFKIYHGDITPENIFINNNAEHKAILIDFGAAKHTD